MDSVYDLRSKRRLFVDKDIRLSDLVRNTPTAATPPQPLPQPPQDKEPAGLAEIRAKFFELSDRVAQLYDDDKDKAIAKDIRFDVLGGKHVRFRTKESDKGRIGDLIRRLKREFEEARLGVDVFDFNDRHVRIHPAVNQFLYDVVSLVVGQSSLASLVLGGQCAEDRDGRRALVELIRFCVRQARGQRCFEHYMALRYPAETLIDKYLVPEALAAVPLPTLVFEIVEVYLAWEDQKGDDVDSPHPASMRYSGAGQAGGQGDDIDGRIRQLVQQNVIANKRIADLEALVHGRTDGMSKPTSKRPGGFRPGMPDPGRRVAFDPKDKKAKPPCPRCGPGQFHGWWQCPIGGAKPGPDGGSQGEAHAPTRREVKTLALCKIFDDAAEEGPRAFRACMMRFGEPALLEGERLEQPERPQPVVQPTGGAHVRWWDRQAVGPLYAGGDGLHYPALPGGSAAVSAPVGANALALAGNTDEDYDSSEADAEFDARLAADRTAYASGEVVAAAPAVSCASRSGGAFPAGLGLDLPLERTRERLVAGGAFPNPPYDSPSPRPLDALADSLTVALEPDIMAAYQRDFLAALRLRDSPGAVPGAGGTAAEDALRMVVPPPGGEVVGTAAEDVAVEDEDEDEDAAAAGAEPADTDV
ncbi:hypothetical protein CYMTET_52632 [Cymbomonas tetramitiformis]|uniref:Uncharacterized protein n=1 Tax=Cymbomonas tetramitiformis TaxID=36881 RepID=A0AAE0ER55_9CHLO|nr:hypothetical protein CYMTET_52632 [Cymbomonas tetramitiformis]